MWSSLLATTVHTHQAGRNSLRILPGLGKEINCSDTAPPASGTVSPRGRGKCTRKLGLLVFLANPLTRPWSNAAPPPHPPHPVGSSRRPLTRPSGTLSPQGRGKCTRKLELLVFLANPLTRPWSNAPSPATSCGELSPPSHPPFGHPLTGGARELQAGVGVAWEGDFEGLHSLVPVNRRFAGNSPQFGKTKGPLEKSASVAAHRTRTSPDRHRDQIRSN